MAVTMRVYNMVAVDVAIRIWTIYGKSRINGKNAWKFEKKNG